MMLRPAPLADAMMLSQLFRDRGLELNSVVQFDNVDESANDRGRVKTQARFSEVAKGRRTKSFAPTPQHAASGKLLCRWEKNRSVRPFLEFSHSLDPLQT
jgi:hypothetical protein